MKKRTAKVALLLDGSRSFDRGLLRGIARYVGLHRPWTFLRPAVFYRRTPGPAKQLMEVLQRQRPDGAIVNSSSWESALTRLRIPIVVVPVHRTVSRMHCLLADNREAAFLAADHLAGQGLRSFAFAGFDEAVWSLERREHFCRRLAERGFTVQSHMAPLLADKTRRPSREATVVRWLKSLPKPVGIMACNDEFARWLSELCRVYNLRIPDQVALVGVDNDELICELSSPPLSSVAFATERAGYDAADLLDSLMAGRKISNRDIIVHASRLVARQSTDLLAVKDEEVVKALRFIRENDHRLVQVNQVVEATFLSHRTLHNRFRQAVGHSLIAEVNRRRAEHIARLLATTNDSISRIARSIGYETAGHMSRFFGRETGMTPRAYRSRHHEPAGRR